MLYVTGITGHTGKIICTVRENSNTSYLDESGLNIEKVVGDLSDTEFLNRTMNGADTVLHIAHINLTPRVLDAAVKNGVKWAILVYMSLSIFAAKVYNKLFKNALISVEQVLRMQVDKAFDHSDAQKDFGYSTMTFKEGIKGEVQEYLSKAGKPKE